MKELWLAHATAPVDFQAGLAACEAQGATAFVQLGAGSALLSFARGTLARPEGVSLLTTAPQEEDSTQPLLSTLGQLAVLGLPVNLLPLFEGDGRRAACLPATPIETQPYWAVERIQRQRPTGAVPPAGCCSPTSAWECPRPR